LRLKDQAPHVLPGGAFPRMTLKIGKRCVKETSQSSTARPQEKNEGSIVNGGAKRQSNPEGAQ
jgi:hypothetical protein